MKRLHALAVSFDALARRERIMVFAAAVTILGAAVFALVVDPALARAKSARAAIAEHEVRIAALRGLHAEQSAKLAQDVNAPVRSALAGAQAELAAVETQIKGFHRSLIPAQDMGQVLSGLLRKEGAARLVSLRNLAPEPLLTEDDGARQGARSAPPRALLYRHGIELVLEGGYFDLLDYLSTLEKQPWRVLWSETNLTARYPVSRLQLKMHTLSLDESWLSV